jgi:4-hydroxybenzoate polyprenyltransferase
LFGLFSALAGSPLTTDARPDVLSILSRVPSAFLLVWANLLVFNIANQRLPDAILEDKLNKPSRPLPSGCITESQARHLLIASIPVVLALSYCLGPWQETTLLFSFNWVYNDLKGSDEDFVVRNLLIAIGYGIYSSAALRVVCGSDASITVLGLYWIVLVILIMFTTQHIYDMRDQAGDKVRGRRSAPLVLGDGVARWTIAIPVIIWSVACPLFLGLGLWAYLVPVSLGLVVAGKTLLQRSPAHDKVSAKTWALWTVVLFSLPLFRQHTIVMDGLEYVFQMFSINSTYRGPLNLVALSSVAMLMESRRLRGLIMGGSVGGNQTLT